MRRAEDLSDTDWEDIASTLADGGAIYVHPETYDRICEMLGQRHPLFMSFVSRSSFLEPGAMVVVGASTNNKQTEGANHE